MRLHKKNKKGRVIDLDKKIILASASPRRKELMTLAGYTFEVKVSEKEECYKSNIPEEIVKELAFQKAEDVAGRTAKKKLAVIGADTVVAVDQEILGKPKTEEEAFAMIRKIAGRTHQVYTGVAVLDFDDTGKCTVASHAVKTDVTVYPMTDKEIQTYLSSEEVMDKAGAYGIQGRFAVFIEKIDGDYYNVMGLPISYLYHVLEDGAQLAEESDVLRTVGK